MPEDRFADLGGGEEKRSAAERFEELDERSPEPQPKPPEPPRRGRYTWVVGIAFVLAIIVARGATSLLRSTGDETPTRLPDWILVAVIVVIYLVLSLSGSPEAS